MANNNNNQPVHLTAPYNFVPLNEYVYIPNWTDEVSQDIPFADGEDGIIEVTWRNVSPLCIRDAAELDDGSDTYYSMHVRQPDGSRLYYLPGSSIRGMLRNTLNIMSFGKMTQYDNKYFGYRSFNTVGNESFGWLSLQGENYCLAKCRGNVEQKSISYVDRIARGYTSKKSAWDRNEYIRQSKDVKEYMVDNCYFPVIKMKDVEYALFATGEMATKEHELLIPLERGRAEVLENKVIDSFLTIYSTTDGADKFFALLKRGIEIPVSYICDDSGEVEALGMSHMLRRPYQYSIENLVGRQQPQSNDSAIHDLCETIFGWTDAKGCKKESMKGRVQFGNAFAERTILDSELSDVSGVLGEPRPSYYPLYIKQDYPNAKKNYSDDKATISGRKLYRIHKGPTVTELPKGNGNEKTLSKFYPVPKDQTFTMRVVVHNLKKVEIGALLSAITFHGNKNMWHNIGTAKGFGYGKLECMDVKLRGLSCDKQEYLKTFEAEMNDFCKGKCKCQWNETIQIQRLAAIMSEHEDSVVKMMDLKEYGNGKTKGSNVIFDDNNEKAPLIVKSDLERLFPEYPEEKRMVLTLREEGKTSEAKNKLEKLVEKMDRMNMALQEDKDLLEELKNELNVVAIPTPPPSTSPEDFCDLLNETYPNDNARYKVDKWKTCKSKVDSWLKKNGESALDDDRKKTLADVVRRLCNNPDKNEKKDWDKPYDKSSIWRKVKEYLGDDAKALYDELTGK